MGGLGRRSFFARGRGRQFERQGNAVRRSPRPSAFPGDGAQADLPHPAQRCRGARLVAATLGHPPPQRRSPRRRPGPGLSLGAPGRRWLTLWCLTSARREAAARQPSGCPSTKARSAGAHCWCGPAWAGMALRPCAAWPPPAPPPPARASGLDLAGRFRCFRTPASQRVEHRGRLRGRVPPVAARPWMPSPAPSPRSGTQLTS